MDSLLALWRALDAHAIVSVTDLAGNILEVNDKFCEVSGYPREALIGRNHRLLKSGVHDAAFYQAMWATISAGESWQGEVCNRRLDGSLYWVRSTITPIPGADGLPERYISIRTDITPLYEAERSARLAVEQLSATLSAIPDTLIELDEDGRFLRIGHGAECHDGPVFCCQLLGRNIDEAFDTVSAGQLRVALAEAIGSGQCSDLPLWIRVDGRQHFFELSGSRLPDADGKRRCLLVVHDATRRKNLETHFAFAIDGAGEGVWDLNLSSGQVQFSGHYEAMLGYAQGELAPNLDSWLAMLHPNDRLGTQTAFFSYLAGQQNTYSVEFRLQHKAGHYIWIHSRGTIVECGADGAPLRVIGLHADISARKRTEEALQLFRRLVEGSGQAIRVADAAHRIVYVNPAYERMVGMRGEDVLGRRFDCIATSEASATVFPQIVAAVEAGGSWQGLAPLRRADGSTFFSLSNVQPIRDAHDGSLLYSFNTFTDHSEELARSQELEAALEQANAANLAKSNFLSSMSHELRTPLNAVIGFAQMLEFDEALDTDQQDNVAEILKAGRHLLALINEVLDLAKIEAGRVELSPEPVDARELIDECVQLVLPLAHARGITLAPSVVSGAMQGDRVRLKQVLLNLLSNAIKYNRDGGSVRLASRVQDGRLTLEVTDTGPGIPAAKLGGLFEPFNRLGAENSAIEGSGIGLSICKRLVELMGGEIGASSEEGIGSRFHFSLPLADAAGASHVAVSAQLGGQGTARVQQRVLYVDDNPANLKLVGQLFARRRPVDFSSAQDARQGLALALEVRPDLILLDVNMPQMDGYQLLDILRAERSLRGVPVVAVTANAMPRDIERGLAAGFAAYLTKPLDIPLFLATVDRLLAEPAGRVETIA
ncbi:PAS domain-containing hybrid sensor histidine kinase/response regulator [Crenobacter intestini]|uniref:histidine kinase n=1 Tax=Crenobacter intestini TaxID=2563443 RepID=A0A4T0UWI4_9NEIS|nr:PAS domain S-box protein [Crenobacter intestini]TIC83409.1 PAS domain S-box protein [Crenobacter intestini]